MTEVAPPSESTRFHTLAYRGNGESTDENEWMSFPRPSGQLLLVVDHAA